MQKTCSEPAPRAPSAPHIIDRDRRSLHWSQRTARGDGDAQPRVALKPRLYSEHSLRACYYVSRALGPSEGCTLPRYRVRQLRATSGARVGAGAGPPLPLVSQNAYLHQLELTSRWMCREALPCTPTRLRPAPPTSACPCPCGLSCGLNCGDRCKIWRGGGGRYIAVAVIRI